MAIQGEHNTSTTRTGGRNSGGLLASSAVLQLIAKLAAHVSRSTGAMS